jgi:hypothetical protein
MHRDTKKEAVNYTTNIIIYSYLCIFDNSECTCGSNFQ